MDDVFNYIPARLTAWFYDCGSIFDGDGWKECVEDLLTG